jgi:transposase-like protein
MRPDAPLPPRAALKNDPASGSRLRASESQPATPGRPSSAVPEELAVGTPDEIQRWTARRRTALVLCILKGEMTVEEVALRHGLAISEVEDWKLRLLNAAHNALRSRPRDEDALKDEQIRRLKQKVGELILDVDALKEALHNARGSGADGGED